MSKLHNDFIIELFKAMLKDGKILDICLANLKKENLQTKFQKKLYTFIVQFYELNNKTPTMGVLAEKFKDDDDIIELLIEIKKTKIANKEEQIIDELQNFIRKTLFINLHNDVADIYNNGDADQAISILAQKSLEISNFSIKENYYTKVFEDFASRNEKRIDSSKNNIIEEKCPSGIPQFDLLTHGGFQKGTSACFLGRSGTGKSLILKSIGVENARMGKRVVHFQAEGTEKECLDLYDACWTGTNIYDMELGSLAEEKVSKIKMAQREVLEDKGEIYIYASESFDSMSLNKARTILQDIISIHGDIDMVIFDYMEIFTVEGKYANGESAERKRREDIANKMTNIAVEFNCVVLTATQANDIRREDYNNENFVMTRSHISEFKGAIKPFSYFITINQTDAEYEENRVRIYLDKMRKYKSKYTFNLVQNRSQGRFFNKKKTREYFYEEIEQFQVTKDHEEDI